MLESTVLQIQFPLLWVGSGVLVVVTSLLFWLASRSKSSYGSYGSVFDSGWGFSAIIFSVFAVMVVIATLVTMVPYNAKYWTIDRIGGTVASASAQFNDGTGSLIGDYIITLKGSSTQYLVNDSRLTSVKAGDQVDMACTLQWNYGGADQFNCALAGAR